MPQLATRRRIRVARRRATGSIARPHGQAWQRSRNRANYELRAPKCTAELEDPSMAYSAARKAAVLRLLQGLGFAEDAGQQTGQRVLGWLAHSPQPGYGR